MINYYNELRLNWANNEPKTSKKSKLEEKFIAESKQLFINIEKAQNEYERFLTEFILANCDSDIDSLYEEEAQELYQATKNSDYRKLSSLEILETVVTSQLLMSRYKKSKITSIKAGA